LGLEENLQGTYFGRAFFKACQYVTTYEKNYENLTYVSIKLHEGDLQKLITWPKKSRKSKQKWIKTCVDFNLPEKKIKYSNEIKVDFSI
jgi:hypothetical protein